MFIADRFPRETGRDYALRVLKDNIIRLELEPGCMVSENELASLLGLSRTPVREALIELSKVDIVEIYPQKGSRIALIDPGLVEQSYFIRETLECEVVKDVCHKAAPSDLEQLRSSLRAQDLLVQTASSGGTAVSAAAFFDLDNQFHRLLYEIAGKEMVYRLIQAVMIHFDRIRSLMINSAKPQFIILQHKDILKSIEEQDDYLAAALVRKHLNSFRDIQSRLYEEHPSYFKTE